MAKMIYQYRFTPADIVVLNMPADAAVLTVEVSSGVPALLVLVDPERPTEQRVFRAFRTRNGLPAEIDQMIYIGTFHVEGVAWHLWEDVDDEATFDAEPGQA